MLRKMDLPEKEKERREEEGERESKAVNFVT